MRELIKKITPEVIASFCEYPQVENGKGKKVANKSVGTPAKNKKAKKGI